eukprot:gene11223-23463_t
MIHAFFFLLTLLVYYVYCENDKPQILDIFLFNGEPSSIYRLYYLKDVVNLFILFEAYETYSGNPKPFLYVDKYRHQLLPFIQSGKLVVEKIHFPKFTRPNNNSWDRERHQRNMVRDMILDRMQSKSFYAIFSDCDEIPNREVIANLSQSYSNTTRIHYRLELIMLYYSFKWRAMNEPYWRKSFILNDVALKKREQLYELRFKYKNTWKVPVIPNAGWHMSYFMSVEDIARKINSISHSEFWGDNFTSTDWIKKCQREGIDLFNRSGSILIPYNGSFGYPQCDECKSMSGYEYFKTNNL